ncbi:YifB family Mg chelatase-like AAA ATPase [Arenicella xantha]|uniref:Magnesium chelatase family protein n=1 Tax=Arenicella xantha TaxID=644221 RepID=A0A395JRV3_9GAMM|nr:YifB family Mg chelatase-like AAA ATPase [Arenicella xantha]RBP51430.1 magnesium chelatase family protein [Arenicella xantha]
MNSTQTGFDVPENIRSLAMVHSRTVLGVNAVPVTVEVHLANGLPSFSTVGMPETAVRESKDRVRGAIINSGFEFPAKRITVNLAPADLPKAGGRFDLPIAIGILVASGQLPGAQLADLEMIGELALNGQLRKVSGVLPTALACGQSLRQLVVPSENELEASLAEQTDSFAGPHLLSVCAHLVGQTIMPRCLPKSSFSDSADTYPDLSDVKGQVQAKRALEIAAAGNHSILFIGPPGTGKSMLATRLPGLLPQLSTAKALEAAAIQSVANGEFDIADWRRRPYRAPHHSASAAALVGGGSNPRPGEISRAHHGILFLDELTEFSRATLEQLREPLETGEINIARAVHSVSYPARFMFVAACNPCRCGYLGDDTDRCQCSASSIEQYRSKLSGPMIDRIDMHLHLKRVDIKTLQGVPSSSNERSATIRQRVSVARAMQQQRQTQLNSQLSSEGIDKYCRLDQACLSFLEVVCEKLHLSARAYHRILKLARTIADMAGEESINQAHLAEAVGYRSLDRR